MDIPSADRTHEPASHAPSRRLVLQALAATGLASSLAGRAHVPTAAQGATPAVSPEMSGPQLPSMTWLGTLSATLGEVLTVGETAHGTRLIASVTGGTLSGPELEGTLLPGGADWMIVRADGIGEIDVRITIRTHDDAILYVTYRGYLTNVLELLPRWAQGEEIAREDYGFAMTPRFETGAPQYDWLQRTIAVGVGELVTGGVRYELFSVGN